ncbi:MAG: DUF4097 family beta strand repeat-containing protein [Candidatus Aminicenantales bacterium]
MRARDVFLALLIIGAGVFLTYEKSGRFDEWFDGWDGLRFGFYDEFTYEETPLIPGPLPAEIRVLNAHGNIEISGAATDRATVVFKKRISARNKAEADRIAADLRMTVERAGDRLILGTNRDSFRRRHFSTDFKIVVPPGTAAILNNSYGLVRVEGTGKTDIGNPHGEIFVRGISGPLVLISSYEAIDVDGVRGDVRIEAPHGEVEVKNLDGGLELDHSYGHIALDRIGGKTIVRASHSGVSARALGADSEIETTYDTIKITEARAVKIRARHCDVEAKAVSGLLDITDDYGAIRVVSILGDLKIEGRNVEVEGREVRSPDVFIKTGYENVFLSGFTGKTTVVLDHGRVTLEPDASLAGAVDVQGTYADVRLIWPAGFRTPVIVQTRDGRITWNLPERPDLETTNGISETRAFTGETGKPGIKVATTHGDVQVDPSGR